MRSILSALLASLMLTSQCFAANEWRGGTGEQTVLGTSSPSDLDTNIYQKLVDPLDRLLSNYKSGCTVAYSSATTITVSAGEVVCENSAGTIRKFRQNTSTTSVTFSDIDTGSEAASTTYYVYAVADADATTFTVKISASSSTPTGVTYYKKLGSFYNDASSNIQGVKNERETQFGDWVSKSADVTYQATSDGFVVAYGTITAGSAGYMYGYSDSSTSPTTMRAKFSNPADWNPSGEYTLTFPVKSRDYYKLTTSAVTATVFFIPKE